MPVRGIPGIYASRGHFLCAREGHSKPAARERPRTYTYVARTVLLIPIVRPIPVTYVRSQGTTEGPRYKHIVWTGGDLLIAGIWLYQETINTVPFRNCPGCMTDGAHNWFRCIALRDYFAYARQHDVFQAHLRRPDSPAGLMLPGVCNIAYLCSTYAA